MTDREEQALIEAIRAARTVQTYLWGEANGSWGIEEWRRMFRKRVAKLDEVRCNNPHASVEMKKRLLQTAALSIALMAIIDEHGIDWQGSGEIPSNLPQYADPVADIIEKGEQTMSTHTCWCAKHGEYEMWAGDFIKPKCPECEDETLGEINRRPTTCFGSVGAAQIMQAAHRADDGEGLEWWDKNGKAVLCLDDFGSTPGLMIWGVRTFWDGFDQTDRKTAHLILRGLLAPTEPMHNPWDVQLGIDAANAKWREKLRGLVAWCRSEAAALDGGTKMVSGSDLLAKLRAMGVEP